MKPKPRGGTARRERVAHALREALTEAIAADVRDPRVHAPHMLTVTRVELNVDLAVANVYVSIVGDEDVAEGALAGLQKAASFLRGPIGRTVGLQHAPELRFHRDSSIDMRDKLAEILREDEAKARAAGREPGDSASAAAVSASTTASAAAVPSPSAAVPSSSASVPSPSASKESK